MSKVVFFFSFSTIDFNDEVAYEAFILSIRSDFTASGLDISSSNQWLSYSNPFT